MTNDTNIETKVLLHNTKCRLTSDGRLEVYHHKLATRLNRNYFKKYHDNETKCYIFKDGEEAVFNVPSDQIHYILSTFLMKQSI